MGGLGSTGWRSGCEQLGQLWLCGELWGLRMRKKIQSVYAGHNRIGIVTNSLPLVSRHKMSKTYVFLFKTHLELLTFSTKTDISSQLVGMLLFEKYRNNIILLSKSK